MVAVLTIFMYLTVVVTKASGKSAGQCKTRPLDIAFLMDSSSSIRPSDFLKQKEFVRNICNHFNIGQSADQSRVAVLVYSHKTRVEFHLDACKTNDELSKRIEKIGYLHGGTDTSNALNTVANDVFVVRHGTRKGIAKVVIVITDGISRDQRATILAARSLKNQGITIFSIGVGKNVQLSELKNIASKPSYSHVYKVTGFQSLEKIKSKLTDNTCYVSYTSENQADHPSVPVPHSTSCHQVDKATDVMFILDSSSFGITGTASLLSAINRTIATVVNKSSNFKFGVLLNTCSNFQNMPLSRDTFASNDFETEFNGLEHLLVQYRSTIKDCNVKSTRRNHVSVIFINRTLTCGMKEQIKKIRDSVVHVRLAIFEDNLDPDIYTLVEGRNHVLTLSNQMQADGVSNILADVICNA